MPGNVASRQLQLLVSFLRWMYARGVLAFVAALSLRGPVFSVLKLQQFFVHVVGCILLVIVNIMGHLAFIMRVKTTAVISRSN